MGCKGDFDRGYKSISEALPRILEESPGYFRGVKAHMARAFVMNSGKIIFTLTLVMIYPYNSVNEHMYNAFGDVFVNKIA